MLSLLRPIAPALLVTAFLAQPALAAGLFAHVAWEHAAEAAHAAHHAGEAAAPHDEAGADVARAGHSHELRPAGTLEPARLSRPDFDPSPAACAPVTLPAALAGSDPPAPAPAAPRTGPPDPQRRSVLRL